MNRAMLMAASIVAVAFAGCAEEPVVIPEPTGTDARDAYAVLADNPVGTDTTLLGVFAHSDPGNRIPWPIGPVSTYEHMHLSGGGNQAMDRGTAAAWYALHLSRDGTEAKVVLSKITSEVTVERTFDASHFGWTMEWQAAEEPEAGDSWTRTAQHGGHNCAVGSFTDDWNVPSRAAWTTATADPTFANFSSTQGGSPLMLYLPHLHTHGDDCTRSEPLGFEFLPQTNVWAVFLTDLDMFLQGGQFGDSIVALVDADNGDLLDVSTFSGTWGPSVRHAQQHVVSSELPGTPALPQTFEVPFGVEEGQASLEVAARLLAGPAVYSDPTIILSGPGFSESMVGDNGDWSVPTPAAGAWTLTYQFDQAQPAAEYTFDVMALTY